MADNTQTAADAAAQLQAQLQPSPLVPSAPGQDPAAAIQALMAQMKDLHTPAAVSWWPLAPGWWLLAILAVIAIVGSLTWWYLRRRRTAYRRAGLRLLKRIAPDDYSPQLLARSLNEILKRTALAAPLYKGMGVAAAHGNHWATFLCNTCPSYPQKAELSQQLIKALYQPKAKVEAVALKDFCEFWISSHQALSIANQPLPEAAHATA